MPANTTIVSDVMPEAGTQTPEGWVQSEVPDISTRVRKGADKCLSAKRRPTPKKEGVKKPVGTVKQDDQKRGLDENVRERVAQIAKSLRALDERGLSELRELGIDINFMDEMDPDDYITSYLGADHVRELLYDGRIEENRGQFFLRQGRSGNIGTVKSKKTNIFKTQGTRYRYVQYIPNGSYGSEDMKKIYIAYWVHEDDDFNEDNYQKERERRSSR